MRACYYSPEMKRFINADIVAGKIFNAVTLNRFAYANGNPVSFVGPFGLSAERGKYLIVNYIALDGILYDSTLFNDLTLKDGLDFNKTKKERM